MFKTWTWNFQHNRMDLNTFFASHFNDPVAGQTDWTPLKWGGTRFRTHKLVNAGAERVAFKATGGAVLFYLAFVAGGLWGLGNGAAILSRFPFDKVRFNTALLTPLLAILLFIAFGLFLLYRGTSPIVFEKRRGLFWKGRKDPGNGIGRKSRRVVRLDDIHALQLIRETVRPARDRHRRSPYSSYELNLVLKEGKRIHLIDHGNWSAISEDAATLAAFLGKPLWDGTIAQ